MIFHLQTLNAFNEKIRRDFIHGIFHFFNIIFTDDFCLQTLNTFDRKLAVLLFMEFFTPSMEF